MENAGNAMNGAWTRHPVDGGMLLFDRDSGANVLATGGPFREVRREAPRTLLVSLLTACNLSCHYCYRDQQATSLLTYDFLADLLADAARWGVIEVAFGGGEPLLFKGFPRLLRKLHETTPLALNFTTNGTLLTPEILGEITGSFGEIRVSAHAHTRHLETLDLLRGQNVGVNWIVTPENVGLIEPHVHEFLRRGARNVLLLGYKGHDPVMLLSPADLRILRRAVRRLADLPILLDVCWHPLLPDVPHLFELSDCGAGVDFLTITSDRTVKACSFREDGGIPFEDIAGLKSIYAAMRGGRAPAGLPGCHRGAFAPAPETVPVQDDDLSLRVWQSWSSNHSSTHTLMGEFKSAETAQMAAQEVRDLFGRHLVFLASPEGKAWEEENDALGDPTPPLLDFGRRHGFDWGRADTNTFYWEAMLLSDDDERDLTARVVGATVYIHHPYCHNLPYIGLGRWFRQLGASGIRHLYTPPFVRIEARGRNDEIAGALRDHLDNLRRNKAFRQQPGNERATPPHPDTPPWRVPNAGRTGEHDVLDDWHYAEAHGLEVADDRLLAVMMFFDNPFEGSMALAKWLRAGGFADVEVTYEPDWKEVEEFDDWPYWSWPELQDPGTES